MQVVRAGPDVQGDQRPEVDDGQAVGIDRTLGLLGHEVVHHAEEAGPTEFPYFTDMGLDKNIARIEKLDEHTVKFTLNEVDAAFIQNLAMPFPSIQSAEYAAQLLKQGKASDINQKPIGTGPFVFSRYQKDAQIRFKGNKDYWKPDEVKVDNLIFAINTDASVRAQKLKAGECQITLNPRVLVTHSSTTPPWVANMFISVSPSIRLFRRELARRWNFRSYSDQSTGLFT